MAVEAATSLTTSLYGWASFGASVGAICTAVIALWALRRKRSSKWGSMPEPPPLGSTPEDYEEFSIRMDQFRKDHEDDE